jgi:hypothetical protein
MSKPACMARRAPAACQRSRSGCRASMVRGRRLPMKPRWVDIQACPTATAARCGWCGSSCRRRRATARPRPARRADARRRSSAHARGCRCRPTARRTAAASRPSSDGSTPRRCTPRPSRPRPWSRGSGAHLRQRVGHAAGVRHLIEAVRRRHRPDAHRLEQDIEAWIARHGGSLRARLLEFAESN